MQIPTLGEQWDELKAIHIRTSSPALRNKGQKTRQRQFTWETKQRKAKSVMIKAGASEASPANGRDTRATFRSPVATPSYLSC